MTERKPAGVSFETWVDRQIREAQARGDFDDLPGKGKPIRGLDGPHDEMWWVKAFLQREGLSFTPPSLAVRRDVERLYDDLARFPSERSVRETVSALNERIRAANRVNLDGPPTTTMPLDVERVVARWRAATAD